MLKLLSNHWLLLHVPVVDVQHVNMCLRGRNGLVLTAVEPYLSLMSNDLFERTLSFRSANIVLATLARMYPKTSSV